MRDFVLRKPDSTVFHLTIILCAALLATAPIFFNGVPIGNDLRQHYQFAQTIHETLSAGEIYPSLSGVANAGYGDYALRFYPPLSYYVLSLSNALTGSWYYGSVLTFFLFFFGAGAGVYLWAREEFPADQSLLAAALYIFAPYHVNQIYNNFLFAEFAAGAVIPFCFLFVTKACRRSNPAVAVAGLSASYAILILTHLPMTVIGSVCFAAYGLFLLKRENLISALAKLSISVALGLLGSSFYWIRMISETAWLNISDERHFQGSYGYRKNFLFAPQNFSDFLSDSTNSLLLADLMLLSVLLICLPSAAYLFRRGALSRFSLAVAAVLILAVFMTTPPSAFVWENVSFLQKTQFPWRWMGIIAASGSLFASIGIFRAADAMQRGGSRLLPLGLGTILVVFVCISSFTIKQAAYLQKEDFSKAVADAASGRSFDCWWTVWAKSEALSVKAKATAGDRPVEILSWTARERNFRVSAGEASKVRLATFYYPHWRATANGQPVAPEIAEDGSISISLPPEAATVRIWFQEPASARIAAYLSASVWFGLACAALFAFFNAARLKSAGLEAEIRF